MCNKINIYFSSDYKGQYFKKSHTLLDILNLILRILVIVNGFNI